MTPKRLTFEFVREFEDIYSLGGGHITAALCSCSPPILFDPGVSAFGPLYLRELARRVSNTDNLILALSHTHFDHCGAAAYLKRKIPSAQIVTSQRGADILKRPNAVELIRKLNAEYEQEMADELAGEDVTFTALEATLKLSDGNAIRLNGGRICIAYETPGHTRDSLTYFFPDTGIAFVGDAAGGLDLGFIHSPYLVSFADYLASIDKIQSLNPRAICIPHNGILIGDDVPRYLNEAKAAAIEYKDIIVRYLDMYRGDQEKVVERITAEEYDAVTEHIQKRQPFILNLRAKVAAVAAWLENRKKGEIDGNE
ncbi:MAG: MBL fold metallo-hydrolase [Desulfobacterota bacterium]|nr:MBL fold metallo-hydrolase [Thermodesulfobacteriota bacterium]